MKNENGLKTYVVHNPVSGTTDAQTVQEKLGQIMDENEIPFKIYRTTGSEDVHDLVRQAIKSGFQRFLVVGGDGTISGVASGLVHTKLPLVIIPTGTVNALARELEIPIGSDDSFRWWLNGSRTKDIDVVQVNERYYLLNISIGTTASIMNAVKREDIHRFGVLPYIREALRRTSGIPIHRFRLTIDGRSVSFRASEIFVANSGMLLGLKALQLDPDASLDNGKLSVCRARLQTIFDYAWMAFRIALQSDSDNDELKCVDALREVRIEANRPVPVQGDGELIGHTPIAVTLIPHALKLVIPPRRSETSR